MGTSTKVDTIGLDRWVPDRELDMLRELSGEDLRRASIEILISNELRLTEACEAKVKELSTRPGITKLEIARKRYDYDWVLVPGNDGTMPRLALHMWWTVRYEKDIRLPG